MIKMFGKVKVSYAPQGQKGDQDGAPQGITPLRRGQKKEKIPPQNNSNNPRSSIKAESAPDPNNVHKSDCPLTIRHL